MAENFLSDRLDYCHFFNELPPVCVEALKKGKKDNFKDCHIWVRTRKENTALIEKIAEQCNEGNCII